MVQHKDLDAPDLVVMAVVERAHDEPGPETRMAREIKVLANDELGCRIGKRYRLGSRGRRQLGGQYGACVNARAPMLFATVCRAARMTGECGDCGDRETPESGAQKRCSRSPRVWIVELWKVCLKCRGAR